MRLVGRQVTSRRLAANSLLVYIECEPGASSGWTFWLEPTWHLVGPNGILAGSRQAQDDDESNPESGFTQAARAVDRLVGTRIERAEIDERTSDLSLHLTHGLLLRTFVADPTDEENWHVRDHASGVLIEASPQGLSLHEASSPA